MTSNTATADTTRIELGTRFVPNPVTAKGAGKPLVFLHGPFGQEWSGYLDDLAGHRRVYAPSNPGADEPDDLKSLDTIHDLLLYYDDLLGRLEIEEFDLVGHSYGAMIAAEYAATYPNRIRKLILIGPMGLWLDDSPVNEFLVASPETLNSQLYHDTSSPEVAQRLSPPKDLASAQAEWVRGAFAVASAAHFSFPIPERGLVNRIHRIGAETLIVHGRQDGLVPPVYASEFARLIPNARAAVIDNAGHFPYLEQRAEVSRLSIEFLA